MNTNSDVVRRIIVSESEHDPTLLVITEQTHRSTNFATEGGSVYSEFYVPGFRLVSCYSPAIMKKCEGSPSSGLFVRGSATFLDRISMESPGAGFLKALRRAVKSYNSHNGVNYMTREQWLATIK